MLTANLLNSVPVFTKKTDDLFVMEIDERYFNVSQEVKSVLQILSECTNYSDATAAYNRYTGDINSVEDFQDYATQILSKFNLDQTTESFLLFEKIIIKPKTAGKTASLLAWLFQPVFFWIFLVILSALSLYTFFLVDSPQSNNSASIPILYTIVLYFVTILFHEFGHLAACRRFTGKNGGLGFGIYIIYPVFYSNISAIWQASKVQKMISNLAGIYMQLWFVLLFFILYNFSNNPFFLDFSKVLSFACFIQLLPFIRSDGYWLLNDIFGIDNLMDKSGTQIKEFFRNPILFVRKKKAFDYGLLFYAAFNIFFIISFAYFQLRYNLEMLLSFPKYLWEILLQIFSGSWSNLKFDLNYLSVILFYFILFNYIKTIFKKSSDKEVKRF